MRKRNYILAALLFSFAPPALALSTGNTGGPMPLGEDKPQLVPRDGIHCQWQSVIDESDRVLRRSNADIREADELDHQIKVGRVGQAT